MKKILPGVIIGLALGLSQTVSAADLSGRWNITSRHIQAYEGFVLIDAERRVTWDSPADGGRPAKFMGYIKYSDASRAEMILTDKVAVVRVECVTEASNALACYAVYTNGTASVMFTLTRVGPTPARLTAPR